MMKKMMKKKIRYIYKITCLCGSFKDHYYLGKRTTYNLNDGYTGSGVKILNYFKHYPKIEGETYIKEIISFHNSVEELNNAEKEIIGDNWKIDPLCLNLKAGGDGGSVDGHIVKEETREKLRESLTGFVHSEESKKHMSEGKLNNPSHHRLGKHHSEEAKRKMSEAKKGKPSNRKGCKLSEEAKRKMSEAKKGKAPWNKGLRMKNT